MELQLLKTLLSSDSYRSNQPKLKRSIFSDDAAELYDLLDMAHAKYEHDLLLEDMYGLWVADHPVATNSEKADFQDLLDDIRNTNAISADVASDVIAKLWQREVGREITNLGINISEGDESAMPLLQNLMERVGESYAVDDFGPPTTTDIYELLEETSDENRWQFNIRSLSRELYGIGPAEFMVVMARPECGKTTFITSMLAGPDGFCAQGAKVLFLANEERSKRTMLRAMQANAGMTREEVADDPKLAASQFEVIEPNLIMKDTQEWTLSKISNYCQTIKPDVLVIDQADKVSIGGSYNSSHERIRELYRSIRELGKRHDCAVIGVCQASAEAEGKTRVDFSMAENSKTGKAAECDVFLGIGKHSGANDDGEPDNTRFLTISKNKISGYHGTIPVMIEPEISRYTA